MVRAKAREKSICPVMVRAKRKGSDLDLVELSGEVSIYLALEFARRKA